jgi:CRP-like cAMP-binding protein
MPDREEMACRALHGAGHEVEMRAELQAAMHGFLASRPSTVPTVTKQQITRIARMADFITRARSAVLRDFRSQLDYAPEPEAPTRFAKVLLSLARGIAMAYDKTELDDADLAMVANVALDCLPAIRHTVISALLKSAMDEDEEREIDTSGIANAVRYSTQTIRRALEDLQALGIVHCHKGGKGHADRWSLLDKWIEIFSDLSDQIGAREYPESEEEKSNAHTTPSDISVTPPDSGVGTAQTDRCRVCGNYMPTAESKRLGICLGCRERAR